MDTSAVRLGVLGVVVVLGLATSSCGGDDAGAEPGGTDVEPSAEQTSPEGGAADQEEPSGEGGEEPDSSPTPVPASSDGPAENWPAPEVPDEIYEETEEGALAALKYWFETATYLQLTGKSEPLKKLSGFDCVMCAQRALQAKQVYEEDEGWFTTSGVEVLDPIVSSITGDGEVSVLFKLNESATQRFNADGTTAAEVGDAEIPGMEAILRYGGDHWEVVEIYLPDAQGG